jgi:hypothetical protein
VYIPPALQYKTKRWEPPFWVFVPISCVGKRKYFHYFLSPWPYCSHSRDNPLSVCWKHIPFQINCTITFIESLHVAWILLLLDPRTKVNFKTIFLVILNVSVLYFLIIPFYDESNKSSSTTMTKKCFSVFLSDVLWFLTFVFICMLHFELNLGYIERDRFFSSWILRHSRSQKKINMWAF